jgi:flagellin FlaB
LHTTDRSISKYQKKGIHTYRKRKAALTGLETAIILISFVIVAAAFSFAVLNLGLFTTQKSGEVVQAGIDDRDGQIGNR